MPLYGNIFGSTSDSSDKFRNDKLDQGQTAARTPQKTGPSASMRLLQDHLLSKKRSKQSSSLPAKTQKLSAKQQVVPPNEVWRQLLGFGWDPSDEYDPMVPNSYEILELERIKAEELKRSVPKNSIPKIDPNILNVLDQLDSEETSDASSSRAKRGSAIAPPPSLQGPKLEGSICDKISLTATQPVDKLDGASAAAKIMAKMGFKAGQGLGKDQQGMSSPLEVEKSGPSAGRIVQRPRSPPTQVRPASVNTGDINLDGSRVLLLQNMVGSGEVDDDLEIETKMECSKYGEVVRCLIYEIPNKLVPDDEAVRIFIEFKDIASSKRAAIDLNGRYFGGRVVRASFFDAERFNKYELGP